MRQLAALKPSVVLLRFIAKTERKRPADISLMILSNDAGFFVFVSFTSYTDADFPQYTNPQHYITIVLDGTVATTCHDISWFRRNILLIYHALLARNIAIDFALLSGCMVEGGGSRSFVLASLVMMDAKSCRQHKKLLRDTIYYHSLSRTVMYRVKSM